MLNIVKYAYNLLNSLYRKHFDIDIGRMLLKQKSESQNLVKAIPERPSFNSSVRLAP